MIYVIASIRLKKGSYNQFIEIFKANIPAVLAEDGCLEYIPTVDIDANLKPQHMDGEVVTIVEKWQSVEALKAHLGTPHMVLYREKTIDLVAEVSLKVLTPA